MNENELIARVLFDQQSVFLPTAESDSYRIDAAFQNVKAKLVIISRLTESSHQAVQESIFSRMLPRVPEQNAQIIYTPSAQFDVNMLTQWINTTHVLLCGVTPINATQEPNMGFTVNGVHVLATDDIEQIDTNASLKKTMWQAWMKQFAA